MPNPWESAPAEHQVSEASPWESAPLEHQEQSPQLADWQKQTKPYTLSNGSQATLRPQDNAVYINPQQNGQQRGVDASGWYRWDQSAKSWQKAPDAPSEPGWAQKNIVNPLANLGRDLQQGVSKVADAAIGEPVAWAAEKLGANDWASQQRQGFQARREEMAQQAKDGGIATKANQVIGEAIPVTLAMMMGQPEVSAGSGIAARIGANALPAMGTAFMSTPGDIKERAQAANVAGIATPVVQVGLEKIAVPIAQRIASALSKETSPAVNEIRDLGERFGVRTSAADEGYGSRKMEAFANDTPFTGMNSWLKGQKQEAAQAAKGVLGDLNEAMKEKGWQGLDEVVSQAKGSGPRAKEAQAVLSAINKADGSGDWSTILQTSGGLKVFQNKIQSDALYSQAEQLAPKTRMPFPQTLQKVNDLKQGLTQTVGSEGQNKALLGYLDSLENDLNYTKSQKDLTYSGFSRLRSALRSMKSDSQMGAGQLVGNESSAALGQLQSAVEKDMQDFAEYNGGKFAQARKSADQFYVQNVVPYKDKAIVNALRNAPPDEVFQKFILKGDLKDRASEFYSMLDPKGQAAVRVGLVSRAMDEATKSGNFSPDVFSNQMTAYRGAKGAIFSGEDAWQLDGFSKLMKAISGSAAFNQASANGRSLIPHMMATEVGGGLVGAAMGHPSALAPAAGQYGIALLAKNLFTTTVGKNLLLAASTEKMGSSALQKLVEEQLPKVIGASVAEETPKNITPSSNTTKVAEDNTNPPSMPLGILQ